MLALFSVRGGKTRASKKDAGEMPVCIIVKTCYDVTSILKARLTLVMIKTAAILETHIIREIFNVIFLGQS